MLYEVITNLNYTDGIWGSKWIGFDNFKFLFASNDAWLIIRNTLLYNISFLLINTTLAVLLALLLNEVKNKIASKFFQSTVILPNFISMVIVGYIVYGFMNPELGFMNKFILEPLGREPINWYAEAQHWPFILTIVNAWKNVGYSAVVYLAAIVGIRITSYNVCYTKLLRSFDFRISLPEELREACIPSLIIQPFVENAMLHGISLMGDTFLLDISVSWSQEEKDMMIIEVSDNGRGVSAEKLAELNSPDYMPASEDKHIV